MSRVERKFVNEKNEHKDILRELYDIMKNDPKISKEFKGYIFIGITAPSIDPAQMTNKIFSYSVTPDAIGGILLEIGNEFKNNSPNLTELVIKKDENNKNIN